MAKKKKSVFRPVRLESLESDRKRGEPVFNREFTLAQKEARKRGIKNYERKVAWKKYNTSYWESRLDIS